MRGRRQFIVTRLSVLAVALAALPAATSGQRTARFVVARDTVLVDQPIAVRLVGVQPRHEVTIRLEGLADVAGWHSSATYRSDRRGRVDLTRTAPVRGDYAGVHAMGLFWSARPDSGAPPLLDGNLRSPDVVAPPPQPWRLVADVDGRTVATDTVWRRAIAPGVKIAPVRERGIVATLYVPAGGGRHPTVVVLTGSAGGVAPPGGTPGGLASRGYTVLALGYFAVDGRPSRLTNIPLEYFGTALDWLAAQPSVDSTRIAVLGQSRGAELALLLGATYPRIHAVVAYVPSNVVWPGTITDTVRAPAWTLGGAPVPGMFNRETDSAVARYAGCPSAPTCRAPWIRHQFLALLDDTAAERGAEIAVERIHGPVLLISGRSDGIWPSTMMADRVIARLRAHRFRYAASHFAYDSAGHGIGRPYYATPDVGVAKPHPIVKRMVALGGTPAGTALASEASWREVLAFLQRSIGR